MYHSFIEEWILGDKEEEEGIPITLIYFSQYFVSFAFIFQIDGR